MKNNLSIFLMILCGLAACSSEPLPQPARPETYESLRDAIKATTSHDDLEKLRRKLSNSKISLYDIGILERSVEFQRKAINRLKNKGLTSYELIKRGFASERDINNLKSFETDFKYSPIISMDQNDERLYFKLSELPSLELRLLKLLLDTRIVQLEEFDGAKASDEPGTELGAILLVQGNKHPVLIQRLERGELAYRTLPFWDRFASLDLKGFKGCRTDFVQGLPVEPGSPIDVSELNPVGSGGQNQVYAYGDDVLRIEKTDESWQVLAFVRMLVGQNLPGVIKIKRILKAPDGKVAAVYERLTKKNLSAVNEEKFAQIALELAVTVNELHALDVKHEDISPMNIMFRGETPVLIDFGSNAQRFSGRDLPDLALSLAIMRTPDCEIEQQFVDTFARHDPNYIARLIDERLSKCGQMKTVGPELVKLAKEDGTLPDFILSMRHIFDN
ncbi:MAG: hypothetical protein V4534_02975 [Myxococcota bacterium]